MQCIVRISYVSKFYPIALNATRTLMNCACIICSSYLHSSANVKCYFVLAAYLASRQARDWVLLDKQKQLKLNMYYIFKNEMWFSAENKRIPFFK